MLGFNIYSLQINLTFDFLLAGLIGFFACAALYKNKIIVSRVLSVVGLLVSSSEIVLAIVFRIANEFWVNSILVILFWTTMIVLFIRAIKAKDSILLLKTFYAIPVLVMLIGVTNLFDTIPYVAVNGYTIFDIIIPMVFVIFQYIVYGAVIGFLILRFVKKHKIQIPKSTVKRKITITAITIAIILLVCAFTPILVMGDVSSSLGTPFSLLGQPTHGYYDNAYNAIRIERSFRSALMSSSNMITRVGLGEYNPRLFEEIKTDSIYALLSWVVIALTLVYSFKILKKRHTENMSAFTPIIILWLCILGVYLTSTVTALLGFIYVPLSFFISGVAVTIIYKVVIKRTSDASMAKTSETEKFADGNMAAFTPAEAAANCAISVSEKPSTVVEKPTSEERGPKNPGQDRDEFKAEVSDKFCFKCGYPLREGSLFCSKCGANLKQ